MTSELSTELLNSLAELEELEQTTTAIVVNSPKEIRGDDAEMDVARWLSDETDSAADLAAALDVLSSFTTPNEGEDHENVEVGPGKKNSNGSESAQTDSGAGP